MKFTDKWLRGVQPRKSAYRIYEKGNDKGFGIKITPAGSINFFIQYSHDGKTRFYNLGRYPSVSLYDARQRCRDARVKIDSGLDPQYVIKIEYGTVGDLFNYYIDNMRESGKRSWKVVERDLLFNCKDILAIPANEITPLQVREVLYKIIQRGADVQANRVRSYLHRCFVIGMQHDNDPRNLKRAITFNIKTNPVEYVPKNANAERVGERNLSFNEIATLWNNKEISQQFIAALRLLLMFGCRPWELMGAEKMEFDFENNLWEIPVSRIKSKRPHILPITEFAAALIQDAWQYSSTSDYLFPARYSDDSPINKTSLQHAVKRINSIDSFTPRDLRRTFKTRTGEIGIEKSIRDRIQNHALDDVSSRHYDRYDYLTEKLSALQIWGQRLAEICIEN